MGDPNREAFELAATHLGYNCTMIGGKYSLYTDMAFKLWNMAVRHEQKRVKSKIDVAMELCADSILRTRWTAIDGLRQERPGT